MDIYTINKIISLNNSFYNSIANEFSNSRQYPFKGWTRINDIIKHKYDTMPFTILDLGCGNGRYLESLHKSALNPKYTGIDSNDTLLQIASERYCDNNAVFINENILNLTQASVQLDKYDIVCSYGVTHHIPSEQLRNDWLTKLTNLVKDRGLIILSFWNFDKSKALKNELQKDLEENDYILGWDNKPDILRYCHYFTSQELDNIQRMMQKKGFKTLEKFEDEISKNKSSTYVIFNKID
jgi:tRNA (uracil-5-)-methyltransferase TRM9